jgi:hypothetical protein
MEIRDRLVMRNTPNNWIPVGSDAINLSILSNCNRKHKVGDETKT